MKREERRNIGLFKKDEPEVGTRKSPPADDKEAARVCLVAADRYIKDGQFEKAQAELDKAKRYDPTNVYIDAFRDRISYFEKTQRKEGSRSPAAGGEAARERRRIEQEWHESKSIPDNSEEKRQLEEERKQLEEERKRFDEELKKIQGEARQSAEHEALRKSEDEIRQRLADERRKADDAARQRIEEESRKLGEERRRAEEESGRRLQEERERLEKELQQKIGEESRRRIEEAKSKAEEDAKRKAQEEVKRIEHDVKKREEEGRQRRAREEAERKAEEEARLAARAAKVQEFLSKAREFFAAREFEDALVEVTKVYAVEPTSEEAQKLEDEIRREKKQEEKRLASKGEKQEKEEKARAARLVQGAEKEVVDRSERLAKDQKGEMEQKLDEMKHQIDELTRALGQEKKARVEVSKLHLEDAAKKLRAALEKAWVNGAPDGKTSAELHSLVVSLSIPETIEQSLRREVKLEMYGRAVKVAIARRNLIRSSSSTLDWLRNVYEVSLQEYLEYESKFLLDLVADQFKGTILLVSQDMQVREEVAARLKATGYAVVTAFRPEEAMEKIEKIHPHFILCDMDFTQGSLSGVKFLQILRLNSKFTYTPFILFCEPKEAAEMESSELRPIEGFVKKPVKFEELTNEMDTKLARLKEDISALN